MTDAAVCAMPDAALRLVLDAERVMRLSADMQARFSALPAADMWMDVVAEEQCALAARLRAEHVHVLGAYPASVLTHAMRRGGWIHAHLRDLSLHVRYNRVKDSEVRVGQRIRDHASAFWDPVASTCVSLSGELAQRRFTVVVSGSLT